jgi:hypothetical protein
MSGKKKLKFFPIVYTLKLESETQSPKAETHVPNPKTKSAKLQAQFLLYTQFSILSNTFCKTLHTILYIRHSIQNVNLFSPFEKQHQSQCQALFTNWQHPFLTGVNTSC